MLQLPRFRLTTDATIAEIVDKLGDPEEYVRCVLGNMLDCEKRYGNASVRIGTTGHGIAPHYRVEPTKFDDIDQAIDSIKDLVAFHGRSHKQLDWTLFQLQNLHWSTRAMSRHDIQTLLSDLRGYKRKES
jgi:hypothetical protein